MDECRACGKAVSRYHYCDKDLGGPWCTACFEKRSCRRHHAEGCETVVEEDANVEVRDG
jgi:hypothetical protein